MAKLGNCSAYKWKLGLPREPVWPKGYKAMLLDIKHLQKVCFKLVLYDQRLHWAWTKRFNSNSSKSFVRRSKNDHGHERGWKLGSASRPRLDLHGLISDPPIICSVQTDPLWSDLPWQLGLCVLPLDWAGQLCRLLQARYSILHWGFLERIRSAFCLLHQQSAGLNRPCQHCSI